MVEGFFIQIHCGTGDIDTLKPGTGRAPGIAGGEGFFLLDVVEFERGALDAPLGLTGTGTGFTEAPGCTLVAIVSVESFG